MTGAATRIAGLSWVIVSAAATASAAPLSDLVPEDAAGAVVVRGIADTADKADRFFRESNLTIPLGPMPLSPSLIIRLIVNDQLKLTKGVDDRAAAAIIWPNAAKVVAGPPEESDIVFIVPFTDLKEIASNFGFFGGLLKPGATRKIGQSSIHVRGRHLVISANASAVAAVVDAAPLTPALDADRRAALEQADVYVHFRPEGMGAKWRANMAALEKEIAADSDAASRVLGEVFLEVLRDLKFVGAAVRFDGGLSLDVQAVSSKSDARGGPLTRALGLPLDGPAGTTAGLPLLHPIGAAAFRLSADAGAAATRQRMQAWLETEPAAKQNPELRDRLVAAVEHVVRRSPAARLVVFRTANAAEVEKVGLLGAVVIVETDSAEAWVADAVMAAEAFNKLFGPAFVHTARAETGPGGRIDTLRLEGAEPAERPKAVAGAQWNVLRMAPRGKSVVLLVGSDVETLMQTLEGIQSGGRSLADHKAVAAAAGRLDARRKAELHVSIKSIVGLVTAAESGKPLVGVEAVEAVTSAALTSGTDRVRLELRIPAIEIRALLEGFKPARGLLGPAKGG